MQSGGSCFSEPSKVLFFSFLILPLKRACLNMTSEFLEWILTLNCAWRGLSSVTLGL
jgi:hypothetical protein